MRAAATLPLSMLPISLLASNVDARPRDRTAEEAVAAYRDVFKSIRELDCPRSGTEEIVVCGRQEGEAPPGRLPLPVEREPGERVRGEPLQDGGGCISRCPQPVMVPLLKVPGFIAKVIEPLKDDE